MTDLILALSNVLFVAAILTYFYLREVRQRTDSTESVKIFQEFYQQLTASEDSLLQRVIDGNNKLIQETLNGYLKHIQLLEKSLSPKPVDRFTEHVMTSPAPQPNDIEKTEDEEKEDNFMDVFSKIPITDNTKVIFEGDGLPEEIL